jgi:hypothetical protein
MTNEEVHKLVELFGLSVDYDQWDEEGKNWIRVTSDDWPDDFGYRNNCLILYKEDGRDIVINELRQSLIHLGENLNAKKVRKALNLE